MIPLSDIRSLTHFHRNCKEHLRRPHRAGHVSRFAAVATTAFLLSRFASPVIATDAPVPLPALDAVWAPHSTVSQTPPDASIQGADEISEKLADPIANLISIPFQFNYDADAGPDEDGYRLTMNFQPVVPIALGDEWLLITRSIVPFIYQDGIVNDGDSAQLGLGDIQQSFFFSPTHSGIEHVKWGIGPIFLWPTATNDSLGGEQWAAGPSGLALYQKNPWTVGILANHLWSYAGEDDRADVNQSFVQPFVSYQFGGGWSGVVQLEAAYDWNDSQWTLPVSAGVSKVTHLGGTPVSIGVQGRYWLDGPDSAPDWGARLVLTFVVPG